MHSKGTDSSNRVDIAMMRLWTRLRGGETVEVGDSEVLWVNGRGMAGDGATSSACCLSESLLGCAVHPSRSCGRMVYRSLLALIICPCIHVP